MNQSMPTPVAVAGALLERGSGGGAAAMRRFCGSWLGAGAWLIVLCVAVYLPGLWSIPPVDRDESRFAQASRQMAESGDYVIPRVQDRPRLNKPPLIYWLQSVSIKVFGDGPGRYSNGNIWVFRLPSVVLAIGSILLTWRIGLMMFDPRAAALGAGLLAVSPMVIWDAHQARADQLLLFTVTLTQMALFAVWRGKSGRWGRLGWASVFWIGVGLGIMAKGPMTPLIAVLTVVAVSLASRSWRWIWSLQPLLSVVILAAIVGPWLYAVGTRIGWASYWRVVFEETIGRSGEAKEGHWGPPGYHLVLLSVLLWPGSLLTAIGVTRAFRRAMVVRSDVGIDGQPVHRSGGRVRTVVRWIAKGRAARSGEVFLIAWALPAWVVMECIATKLPHYTMPLYPALALLSARAALSASTMEAAKSIGSRIGFALWSGIGFFGLCLTLALVAGFGGLGEIYGKTVAWAVAIGGPVVIGACIWLAGRAIGERRFVRAHVLGVIACVVWVMAMLGWVLPRSEDLWVSRKLEAKVQELSEERAGAVALVGYQEDSAIFLLRGAAERIDADYLPVWMKRHPRGIVAIETTKFPDAVKRVEAAGWDFGARVEGYNYSVGRRVVVELYSRRQ